MSDDQLAELRSTLDETYTPEGVDIWLEAHNRRLDGQRPIDLIAAGRIGEVIEAARRIEGAR